MTMAESKKNMVKSRSGERRFSPRECPAGKVRRTESSHLPVIGTKERL